MSFLRKWGNSSGPTGSNGGNGAAAAEAAKVEWYNETPGERYFGMENVSHEFDRDRSGLHDLLQAHRSPTGGFAARFLRTTHALVGIAECSSDIC